MNILSFPSGKKRSFCLICLVLCFSISHSATAQIVSWSPLFPTADDVITITFDATQGTGGLEGCPPPVYLHSGVITDQSTSPTDWQHVPTQWGIANSNWEMTPLGNNLHEITYHIRSFYNIPENEEVLQLAFVFRNADGSKEGKETGGLDIYTPVYSAAEAFQATFTAPTERPYFGQLEENFNISVETSQDAMIDLYIDNVLVTSGEGINLTYEETINTSGKKWVRFEAQNEFASQVDSFYYIASPEVETAPVPTGLVDGINYHPDDESKVTLNFYAPQKNFIYVIGDFTNWELDPDYFMKRDPNGNHFWLEIEGLTAGEEYAYQYFIDGDLRVADPYAEKVLDSWNDDWISEDTYPNLKPYPAELAPGYVSVLQTGQEAFNWQNDDFVPPAKTDLVIYELLIRDFTQDRNFQSLIDTLDYLENLGINAIELLPVMEFEGNDSWGYNPSFHLALDKYYGTKNAFKQFIDECHGRGIAVILDIVLNHAFGQSPLVKMYPLNNSPYFNENATHPFNVGYDFNHESSHTQRFLDRVNLHWLEEYHADGYRFDLSKGFTQTNNPDNVGAWSNYDGSRVALLQRMADVIWADFPDAYLILEHFAANNEEQELSDYGMMLWGNMNHAYNELTMGWVATSSFDGISYKERFFNDPHLVGYMESHDEERLMFRNLAFGNTSNADHNAQNEEIALQRGEMAAALFFTVPGPKMVWQFGELGYDEELNDCRLCPKPLHWEYFDNPARNHLYMVYKALIDLKLDNEAFQTDNFAIQTTGLAKQLRLLDESMNVVVIANGDVVAQDIIPPFPAAGTYYDYFSGESIEVVDAFATFNMAPGEFHIYTTEPLPTPELVTGIGGFDQAVYQVKNYPNPFNQSLNISYNLPKTGKVRLSIVDILGREVAVLQNGTEQAGEQIISWQANRLESGTYFFVLETEDGKATGKLSKAKQY